MALTDRAKQFLQQRDAKLTPRTSDFLDKQFPTVKPKVDFSAQSRGTLDTGDMQLPQDTRSGIQKAGEISEKFLLKPGFEALQGATKEAGRQARFISTVGEKIIGAPTRAILGEEQERRAGIKPDASAAQQLIPESLVTAKTPAEKAGAFGVQLAEFYLGGQAAANLGTSLSNLIGTQKLQPVLGRLADIGIQSVTSGLGSAGVAGLQEASPEEIKKTGLTSAAITGAFGTLGLAKDVLTQKLPTKIINRILSPTRAGSSKMFSFGKNPGSRILEEGIKGNTREQLLKNIKGREGEIFNQLDELLDDAAKQGKTINLEKVLSPIDDAIEKATKAGEKTLVRRLLDVKGGLTKNFKLVGDDIVAVGAKKSIVTPQEANAIKQGIGSATKWTGQAFDNDVNQVRVAVYRNLDKEIDNIVPAAKELNNRMADLISAKVSLNKTIDAEKLKALLPGIKELGIGGAVGLGSVVSDLSTDKPIDPVKSLLRALGTTFGVKALGSVPVQSNIARALSKSPGIVKGLSELLKASILAGQTPTGGKNTGTDAKIETLRRLP